MGSGCTVGGKSPLLKYINLTRIYVFSSPILEFSVPSRLAFIRLHYSHNGGETSSPSGFVTFHLLPSL